ncbi:hypothetical protein CEUSTIGMA_g7110.t1 [Chlamydomonas eustigma]|uniref:Uncharacterized protein n=1 Tax=Chlamydomonas eustigma TaxID=1157962 RepID=A0A250X9U9_9CHLO|nr:hypothetical protein CEUSTIGMA_g7110.t1 [Chlamydomonas eustigma]|eukprot:GAX79669.1 hypothetical protein CEUSTIGMA_g7110.t1 [Chlamydomonas eustigma]
MMTRMLTIHQRQCPCFSPVSWNALYGIRILRTSLRGYPVNCSKTNKFPDDSLHRYHELSPAVNDVATFDKNEWEGSVEELTWDNSEKRATNPDADGSNKWTPKYGAYILLGLILLLSVIVWQLLRAIGSIPDYSKSSRLSTITVSERATTIPSTSMSKPELESESTSNSQEIDASTYRKERKSETTELPIGKILKTAGSEVLTPEIEKLENPVYQTSRPSPHLISTSSSKPVLSTEGKSSAITLESDSTPPQPPSEPHSSSFIKVPPGGPLPLKPGVQTYSRSTGKTPDVPPKMDTVSSPPATDCQVNKISHPILPTNCNSTSSSISIPQGGTLPALRARAQISLRAAAAASEASQRAAAYSAAASTAASRAAEAAERAAVAATKAQAALEVSAEDAIIAAESRAQQAAVMAKEAEDRAARSAASATAYEDLAQVQASVAIDAARKSSSVQSHGQRVTINVDKKGSFEPWSLKAVLSSIVQGITAPGFHNPAHWTDHITEPEGSKADTISQSSGQLPESSTSKSRSSSQDIESRILSGAKSLWQRLTNVGPSVHRE